MITTKIKQTISADDVNRHKINLCAEIAQSLQAQVGRELTVFEWQLLAQLQTLQQCAAPHGLLKRLPNTVPNIVFNAQHTAALKLNIPGTHHPYAVVLHQGMPNNIPQANEDHSKFLLTKALTAIQSTGAECIGYLDQIFTPQPKQADNYAILHAIKSGIAQSGNSHSANLAGSLTAQNHLTHPVVSYGAIGMMAQDALVSSQLPAAAGDYHIILTGQTPTLSNNTHNTYDTDAYLDSVLTQANNMLFRKLQQHRLLKKVCFKAVTDVGLAAHCLAWVSQAGYGAELNLGQTQHYSLESLFFDTLPSRYLWCCPAEISDLILEHYNHEFELPNITTATKAIKIGEIRASQQFILHDADQTYIELPVGLSMPAPQTKNTVETNAFEQSQIQPSLDTQTYLMHPDNADQTLWINAFDKQGQNKMILSRGQASATLLCPLGNHIHLPPSAQNYGLALSTQTLNDASFDVTQQLSLALLKILSVGAKPLALSLSLNQTKQTEAYVETLSDMCHQLAHLGLSLPIMSSNLNAVDSQSILSCLTALGELSDVDHHCTLPIKQPDTSIAMIFWPTNKLETLAKLIELWPQLINTQQLSQANVIAPGQLSAALIQMVLPSKLGLKVLDDADVSYFDNTQNIGLTLTTTTENRPSIIELIEPITPLHWVAQTTKNPEIILPNFSGNVHQLRYQWQETNRESLS